MDNNGEFPKFITAPHVDAVEVRADGHYIEGHTHASPGVTEDEVRELTADYYGVDPDAIKVRFEDPEKPKNVGRRVFGFSNWNGSNWQPTGPQSNPNLN